MTPRSWGQGAALDDLSRRRRRFRVAHELAHTYFYVRRDGYKPARAFRAGQKAEEDFCDEFARELLAPSAAAVANLDAVVAMQQEFDVSLEVAVRAASTSSGKPRMALLWWSPVDHLSEARLIEQWASDPDLLREIGIQPFRTNPLGFEQPESGDVAVRVLRDSRQMLVLAPR